MRWAGHVAVTWERCVQGFGRRPEGRNHLEDVGVDGRIMLKWIQQMGLGGMGWIDLAEDRGM
jgi:hypothetical protein